MPNTRASSSVERGIGVSSDAIKSNEDRSYKMPPVELAIMLCQAPMFALMLLYARRLAQMRGHNWWVSYNVVPGTGISFYVIISINP